MRVTLDVARATIRKVSTTAAESERLDREAAVLAAARHPGVVQLRAAAPAMLEIRAVTGWCLSDIGGLRPAEVAGIGCAIATILGDLHDLGIVHGAVESSHVLIGSDDRPVLCSLGRGRLRASAMGPDPTDDVVALIALLSSLLAPSSEGGEDVERALRTRRRLGRPPSARELATRLAAVPGVALPDPAQCVWSRLAGSPDSPLASPRRSLGQPGPRRQWR
jgi:hypothetical protein